MSANFTPDMGNFKDMSPFKMWCQKVLPLVYDDSLSYYEVLCKVVKYLNEIIENMDVLHDDVDALHDAYERLQSYVNDYFDNLNVQTEINNKLDDMATSGELSGLIQPFVTALMPTEVGNQLGGVVANQIGSVVGTQLPDVVASQLPPEVATQVPSMVTSWLNEHIVQPVEVIIDDSLSIQGAAADAKATGDALSDLNNALKNYPNYVRGAYSASEGNVPSLFSVASRISADGAIKVGADWMISVADGYACRVIKCNANKQVIGSAWKTGDNNTIDASDYVYLVLKKSDDSALDITTNFWDIVTCSFLPTVIQADNYVTGHELEATKAIVNEHAEILTNDIPLIENNVFDIITPEWTIGALSASGSQTSSTNTIRTEYMKVCKGTFITVDSADYVFRVYKYSDRSSSSFTGRTNELTAGTVERIASDMFIKITLQKADSSDVSDTSISSHIKCLLIGETLTSEIGKINNNLFGYDYVREKQISKVAYTPASSTNINLSSNTNYDVVSISCNSGDVFLIKSVGDTVYRLWSFANDNLEIITSSGSLNQLNNTLYEQWRFIDAPLGATKLYVNIKKTAEDPHIYKIPQTVLADEVMSMIGDYNKMKKSVCVPSMPNIYTHLDTVEFDWTEPLTLAQIYAKYDALVSEHPDYWTRTELGTDQSGTYTIYRYDFAPVLPKMINNYGEINYSDSDAPVVIMDFGIHGNEKPIVHAGINFFYKVTQAQDNDIWGWFHDNIHFVIIPVVNPWGYENNVRVNSRHVNLNRNFRPYWVNGISDSTSDNYRGESPLSEKESQYVSNILAEYKDKAVFYYGWHTHGVFTAYEEMTSYALRGIKQPELLNIGIQLIQAITRNGWQYHDLPKNLGNSKYIGIVENLNSYAAVAAAEGAVNGIPSVDPEGLWKYYDGTGDISNSKVYKSKHNLMNVEYIMFAVALGCEQFLIK